MNKNDLKRVSVIIPTFNGEKYIRDQINSIINQTYRPDEIIISDDGSTDGTLSKIPKDIIATAGIKLIILTDNPKHGWIGNYEWASKHASGDYIFNCDQDDIWMEDKIESVIEVFQRHPDAMLVAHDMDFIDKKGKRIDVIIKKKMFPETIKEGETIELKKNDFLSRACCESIFVSLVTCVTKELLEHAIPFPQQTAVDQWEPFCALCYGKVYYLHRVLARHRLHEANLTTGGTNHRVKKTIRVLKRMMTATFSINPYYGSKAMREVMEELHIDDSIAWSEIKAGYKLGIEKKKIAKARRTIGVIMLLQLYRKSARYRQSGREDIIYDIIAILRGRTQSM